MLVIFRHNISKITTYVSPVNQCMLLLCSWAWHFTISSESVFESVNIKETDANEPIIHITPVIIKHWPSWNHCSRLLKTQPLSFLLKVEVYKNDGLESLHLPLPDAAQSLKPWTCAAASALLPLSERLIYQCENRVTPFIHHRPLQLKLFYSSQLELCYCAKIQKRGLTDEVDKARPWVKPKDPRLQRKEEEFKALVILNDWAEIRGLCLRFVLFKLEVRTWKSL